MTMTNEVFLAQLRTWIHDMRHLAASEPGTGACTVASAMHLWHWTLDHLQHAKDAKMRIGLARAALSAGEPALAAQTLQDLFNDEPERYTGASALLLAHAHADRGDPSAALAAFDEALQRHNGIETRCDYGLYLTQLGRDARAREMLEGVMRDARLVDEHARMLNRASLDQARAALRALDERRGSTA